MTGNGYKTEHAIGAHSDVRASEPANTGSRPTGFDCFASKMGEAMAECPCGFIMRRHRVAAFAMLAVTGLAALAIGAGAILGIIEFLRTF